MGHRLCLTTGVCMAQYGTGPTVPLTGMETVQERPLLSWEGETSYMILLLLAYAIKTHSWSARQ